ncbi:hypothetical protein EfmAA610_21040 [Enterococcus faecium]|nr:hypothetical protein EfmAA610_21040 [Enterococcus faecium]
MTPEYTYQKDLADDQNNRIKQLFELIDKTNDTINKSYNDKVDKAKEDENIPKPKGVRTWQKESKSLRLVEAAVTPPS